MVVPWLMEFMWRNKMGKGAELLFSVPVYVPFWGLVGYEPLIVFFCLLSLVVILGDCVWLGEVNRQLLMPYFWTGVTRGNGRNSYLFQWKVIGSKCLKKLSGGVGIFCRNFTSDVGNYLHVKWCGVEVAILSILRMVSQRLVNSLGYIAKRRLKVDMRMQEVVII